MPQLHNVKLDQIRVAGSGRLERTSVRLEPAIDDADESQMSLQDAGASHQMHLYVGDNTEATSPVVLICHWLNDLDCSGMGHTSKANNGSTNRTLFH
jgi:hypothetical protein